MPSQTNTSKRGLTVALWANAGLLAVLIVVLLGRNNGPQWPQMLPAASAQVPVAGGSGLFLMPGQLATNVWGCYLMDVDRQTLMVYQYDPARRMLLFRAARDVSNDRRLGNFNTTPEPQEIREVAEKERQDARVRDAGREAEPNVIDAVEEAIPAP